jgi:hypothetical protein
VSRRLVPVAESRLKTYLASSRAGFLATGGTFWTSLWRPVISKAGAKMPFSQVFTTGCPQMNTKTVRTIQGIQARKASPPECFLTTTWAVSRSSGKRQMFFGCQNLSSAYMAVMETMAATMSTSSGPK